MNGPRVALAAGSLACVVAANTIGVVLGPAQPRPLIAVCALFAAGAALFALLSREDRVGLALAASLPAVLALMAADEAWLVGPLGVLLLGAAELCAWSWEQRGAGPDARLPVRRIARSAVLCGIGLVVSLLCYALGRLHPWSGTLAVFVAAVGVAVVVWVVTRAAGRDRQPGDPPGT